MYAVWINVPTKWWGWWYGNVGGQRITRAGADYVSSMTCWYDKTGNTKPYLFSTRVHAEKFITRCVPPHYDAEVLSEYEMILKEIE